MTRHDRRGMQRFIVIVLCAAAVGGLAAIGLLETIASQDARELQVGGVTIPVDVSAGLYDRTQLRLGIATGAILTAIVSCGLSDLFGRARRRR